MERALRGDPSLEARRRTIADHLARYEVIDDPPPPPFTRLAPRLGAPRRAPGASVRVAWGIAAAAAIVVVALAVGLWVEGRPDASAFGTSGDGILVTHAGHPVERPEGALIPGDVLEADEPAQAWIGDRVHLVLDGGARLSLVTASSVRLDAGRAFFDVAPGSFRVATAAGDVVVLGTRFEVAMDEGSLFVAVAEGRVEVTGSALAAGEALVDGRVVATPHEVGGFFRRPLLRLTSVGDADAGVPVSLRFTFANPGRVPLTLAGPEGVRAALWLEVVDPSGEVHDVPVPEAGTRDGPLPPGSDLALDARSEVSFTVRLPGPFAKRGVYRCRALYRPEGQPSLVSDVLLLEVR